MQASLKSRVLTAWAEKLHFKRACLEVSCFVPLQFGRPLYSQSPQSDVEASVLSFCCFPQEDRHLAGRLAKKRARRIFAAWKGQTEAGSEEFIAKEEMAVEHNAFTVSSRAFQVRT